ncbi:MAG: hypothetical protein R6W82_05515 [bacterium]
MPLSSRPLPAASLLSLLALLLLPGCEESLPTYARPEAQLAATFRLPDRAYVEDLDPTRVLIVDVLNVSDDSGLSQFVLNPPFEVRVAVTVRLARDPGRMFSRFEATRRTFGAGSDPVGPGELVRMELEYFPLRDDEGRVWNWGEPDLQEHELIFQGEVRVPEASPLPIVIPSQRVTLIYDALDP